MPTAVAERQIRIAWFTDEDGLETFLGAFLTLASTGKEIELDRFERESYEMERSDIEGFVAKYQQVAENEGAKFLTPTDLYDDFEGDE